MESPKKWLRLKQADSSVLDATIFDDFEDAKKMTSTVCQQVSMEEYESDIRSETDKALGDLCTYLDKHPDEYAHILRKRKQEELEQNGLVSFVKSKVMKLVQGEDYPENLVSTTECLERTNSLKAGLCKTFQYSQETKGTPNSHPKRLASKHNGALRKCKRKSRLENSTLPKSFLGAVSDSHKDAQPQKSPVITIIDFDKITAQFNGSLTPNNALVIGSIDDEERNSQNGIDRQDVQQDIGLSVKFSDGGDTEQSTSSEFPVTGSCQDEQPHTSTMTPSLCAVSPFVAAANPPSKLCEPSPMSSPQAANRQIPSVVTRRSLRMGRDGDHRESVNSSPEAYESANSTLGYSPAPYQDSPALTPMLTRKRTQKSCTPK